jgi:hypothetical protein
MSAYLFGLLSGEISPLLGLEGNNKIGWGIIIVTYPE